MLGALKRLALAIPKTNLSRRLSKWEYRAVVRCPWEAWRKANDDANTWARVEVPHCFNAFDAVDPDGPYYQGPGWYRTRFELTNRLPAGRTLLHFEGAGQKTEVFVHTERVASHVGGYDEFVSRHYEPATSLRKCKPSRNGAGSIMCDNSRDLEMILPTASDSISTVVSIDT